MSKFELVRANNSRLPDAARPKPNGSPKMVDAAKTPSVVRPDKTISMIVVFRRNPDMTPIAGIDPIIRLRRLRALARRAAMGFAKRAEVAALRQAIAHLRENLCEKASAAQASCDRSAAIAAGP